jgi:hypothetical protein
MPCRKKSNGVSQWPSSAVIGQTYTTEADCLQACKEGACCEGTACTVKPQCQCQGTGKTFKGVGTTCGGSVGFCCGPGTWSAKDIVWSGGFASFPSAQSFPQCRSYSSEAGAPVTTQSACEASGGMWVTTPCVSCAEVNEKTGLGGSQKFVCYPAPNPLP